MITIDPNLRGCGVACWSRGVLQSATYVKNPRETGRGYYEFSILAQCVVAHVINEEGRLRQISRPSIHEGPVIIEMPRVYPGMPKVDLNDLLDVCGVGSAVAAELARMSTHRGLDCTLQTVFPSEWKGTLKKQAMLERIASKLTQEEAPRVQRTNKSDTEDILDGVGIGLWKLGRLNTKVYPGAER